MEFFVRRLSPPRNHYFYVREENLGSTRKFIQHYLLFMYFQPNSCNTHAEHQWAGGTFRPVHGLEDPF
jgi:hypothetical protein